LLYSTNMPINLIITGTSEHVYLHDEDWQLNMILKSKRHCNHPCWT
jgi:hypothetical protein